MFSREEEYELYKQAIAAWGIDSQLLMVAEECSELITEIMKSFRTPIGLGLGLIAEAVDVQIMINQLKTILDKESWNEIYSYKLRRLQSRLEVK